MNVNVYKILIVAFVVFHLSWETSAAPIEGEASEAIIVGEPSPTPTEEDTFCAPIDEEISVASTEEEKPCESVDDIEISFKCGNLECPNATTCEIRRVPSDDGKTITKTTQCKDADGNVLAEEITIEDVPDGKIPFTSVTRKTIKGGSEGGAYFGGSYAAKSIVRGGLGTDGKTIIDIVPIDGDGETECKLDSVLGEALTVLNKQKEILGETRSFFERVFGNWFA